MSKRKERKLVLEEHGNTVLMAVIEEGCDHLDKVINGNLEDALATVPEFLSEAQQKWQESPKMPAYKPLAPAPTEAAKPTDELPLLKETEKAEEKAEVVAEEQPELEAEQEKAGEEERVAEAEAEVTEPVAAAPATEAEPTVPVPDVAAVAEEFRYVRAPSEPGRERLAQATGEWEYWLKDDRGPYLDIQAAMDAMGLDKESRPHHQRWDRLSTQLKEQIQRRPKP